MSNENIKRLARKYFNEKYRRRISEILAQGENNFCNAFLADLDSGKEITLRQKEELDALWNKTCDANSKPMQNL